MKRVALAALFASLTLATAAPAFADEYDDAVAAQISKIWPIRRSPSTRRPRVGSASSWTSTPRAIVQGA